MILNFFEYLNLKEGMVGSDETGGYRGLHEAPGRGNGSPLHDVTGVYPDDIYSLPLETAARYYGHAGDINDASSINFLRIFRNKPNASVKIFRAVPNINFELDKKIKNLSGSIAYLNQYGFPSMKNPEENNRWHRLEYNKEKYIEELRKEIQNLESQKHKKLTINPGDWVTLNRKYAEEHGKSELKNQYKIISKTVKAKDLYTDGNSVHEFGYDP